MLPSIYDEQERLRRLLHAKGIDIDDGVVLIGETTGGSLGNADVYIDDVSYTISIQDLETIIDLSDSTDDFKIRVRLRATNATD